MAGLRLMNFGCGSVQPVGWINADRGDFGQPSRWDALAGIPFEDDWFDGVLCSHSLQENDYHDLPLVLAELRRVLKPGGVMRVLWPDVAAAVRAWQRRDRDWFPVNNTEPGIDDALCVYLNWFGTARTLCTRPRLVTLLERAGFVYVAQEPFGVSRLDELADLDDREPEEQLIVECEAP